MVSIIKTEFSKMKRYSVIWIGVATMFTVVLLARFMATASDGATHTLMNFSSSVIWNNLVLIYPATIALIAGYIIDRERTDDTLKKYSHNPCFLSENADWKTDCCWMYGGSAFRYRIPVHTHCFLCQRISRIFYRRYGTGAFSDDRDQYDFLYCSHACYCFYCSKKRQLYGRCWLCFLLWFCGNDGLRPQPA